MTDEQEVKLSEELDDELLEEIKQSDENPQPAPEYSGDDDGDQKYLIGKDDPEADKNA